MSFLGRLGLDPVDSHESNHGTPTGDVTEPSVPRVSLSLSVPSDISTIANSPETAKPDVTFGANRFSSTELVIAKGYFVTIPINEINILDLFLYRTNNEHHRVAQLMVDSDIHFTEKAHAAIKLRGGKAYLFSGVHALAPGADGLYTAQFYFLSHTPF